jgi:hypothetical protein
MSKIDIRKANVFSHIPLAPNLKSIGQELLNMNTFILSFMLVCGLNSQQVKENYSNYGDALDQLQSMKDSVAPSIKGQSCEYKNIVIGNTWDIYKKSDKDLNLEIQKQVKFSKIKTDPKQTLKF